MPCEVHKPYVWNRRKKGSDCPEATINTHWFFHWANSWGMPWNTMLVLLGFAHSSTRYFLIVHLSECWSTSDHKSSQILESQHMPFRLSFFLCILPLFLFKELHKGKESFIFSCFSYLWFCATMYMRQVSLCGSPAHIRDRYAPLKKKKMTTYKSKRKLKS